MPDTDRQVLATNGRRCIVAYTRAFDRRDGARRFFNGETLELIHGITHWRDVPPLPEGD
jgi:hypothetical protein